MKQQMKICKAVFPVAGFGTRFLPATKTNPKEMLPIVDKPLIQYAVEEAINAGINELIFVTSSNKRAIEDHFDRNFELEQHLIDKNKKPLLKMVDNILPKNVSCAYIRQPEQLGLGHAIACAQPLIGDQPFAVLLADDLIDGNNCLNDMVNAFQQCQSSILAVLEVEPEKIEQYGMVKLTDGDINQPIENIVEKPKLDNAPSTLGVVGRYILTANIFTHLATVQKGFAGEIQLTDAIATLIQEQSVYAHKIVGQRYDCGSKIDYLKAIVNFGLKHPTLRNEFHAFLKEVKG